jgi:muramoyltetrapeptide carboxypeptidase
VPREAFVAGVARLETRYKVLHDEGALSRTGYLAGDDDRRADELNRYLRDPDVRAIIPARGGYGLMRILERLDADALRRDPKVIVGFSDVTALLAWAVSAAQVRPVHGPMAGQLANLPDEDVAWLWRVLEDAHEPGPIPGGPFARVRGGGALEGRLAGGNLEMVTRLLGTPYALDLGASILFIEDVGERPYRVDRQLTHLKLAGALEAVRGVALGEFVRCDEPQPDAVKVEDVLRERLEAFELPALAGLPIGHGARNVALPLGARAVLDVGGGQLVVEEGAVQ